MRKQSREVFDIVGQLLINNLLLTIMMKHMTKRSRQFCACDLVDIQIV